MILIYKSRLSDEQCKKNFYCVIESLGLSTLDPQLAQTYREKYSVKERSINTTTLNQIIVDHSVKDIHFLKIDAEGEEKKVLSGLDLKVHRPWIIVIESIDPVSLNKNHECWEDIILANQYQFVFFDGINRYYLAKIKREKSWKIY